MKTFGQWLRGWRKASGKTQAEAATALLISNTYLCDMEADRRGAPPAAVLDRIAGVYSLNADVVFFRAGQLPPRIAYGDISTTVIKECCALLRGPNHE